MIGLEMTTHDREFRALLKALGASIKKRRLAAGLTQEELDDGGKYSFELKYLQRIESGRNVTVKTLHKLAKRFNIRIRDLFDFE